MRKPLTLGNCFWTKKTLYKQEKHKTQGGYANGR